MRSSRSDSTIPMPRVLGAAAVLAVGLVACVEANPSFRPAPFASDAAAVVVVDAGVDADAGCVCDRPPGPCYEPSGDCDAQGVCRYRPTPLDTACAPRQGCERGVCDGDGRCRSEECALANGTAGSCIGDRCDDLRCVRGWADCNGRWQDGCEVDLATSTQHCGRCGRACPRRPNSLSVCEAGRCTLVCEPPFEDCNNDPTDGCEIPVGEPNACSREGLTDFVDAAGATPGCGTPHCGPGVDPLRDESFDTWHCTFCAHCQLFEDGGAWCLKETGTFSPKRCSDCCDPDNALFPQVCAAAAP